MTNVFNPYSGQPDASNQVSALVFGLAMVGVALTLAIAHWSSKIATRCFSKSSACGRAVTALQNTSRRLFARTTFKKPHGRIMVIAFYLATNITLTIINLNYRSLSTIAKRLGWMAVCNLCLTVFLGIKNTPLSPLVGRSYQHLNVLHRCSGFTTILFILTHGTMFVISMAQRGRLNMLQSLKIGSAVIAALSTLIMLATAVKIVRKGQYELFKVVHMVCAAVILFMVGYHTYTTPVLRHKSFFIVSAAAGFWMLDRTVRAFRWIIFLAFNHCTIYPLPGGATRVVMRRGIRSAQPGAHVHLWIPGICLFQSHPFTPISETEMVVVAREGFTRKLYELASQHPEGLRLRAAIEGPYGAACVPRTDSFDKIVLIAGGSGATFNIAVALNWVRQFQKRKADASLEFVWAMKNRACLEWFDEELNELQACTSLSLSLHVTEENASDKISWPFAEDIESEETDTDENEEEYDEPAKVIDDKVARPKYFGPPTIRVVQGLVTGAPREKPAKAVIPIRQKPAARPETQISIVEQEIKSSTTFWNLLKLSKSVLSGRPNVDDTLYAMTEHLWRGKRVLVVACGPPDLLQETRNAVLARSKWNLPEMQLHLEDFGS